MPLFRRQQQPRHAQRIFVGQEAPIPPADTGLPFDAMTANLSTGGTSIDRTDEIHPANATARELAATVVRLDPIYG